MTTGFGYYHMLKIIYKAFISADGPWRITCNSPFVIDKFVMKYSDGGKLLKG